MSNINKAVYLLVVNSNKLFITFKVLILTFVRYSKHISVKQLHIKIQQYFKNKEQWIFKYSNDTLR